MCGGKSARVCGEEAGLTSGIFTLGEEGKVRSGAGGGGACPWEAGLPPKSPTGGLPTADPEKLRDHLRAAIDSDAL